MDVPWIKVLDVVLVCALLVPVSLVLFNLRRRGLRRRGGTFDCSLRRSPCPGAKGWTLGMARYSGGCIEWFRVFSFAPRPKYRIARHDVTIVSRRDPVGHESYVLLSGSVVLECLENGRPIELALSPGALTGFLSWLEAAPPGQNMYVA